MLYELKNWKLMFIGTDEGYVSAVYPDGIDNKFKFQYVYNHTDHLGNIRQNITKENGRLTVLREHNYYPFGLLHRGYNEEKEDLKYDKEQDFIFTVQAQAGRYRYKFQGQERQEDLDLGWDSFKYRNYDYAIGRFFNVDPLAEKFPYNGVYNFSENRVVDGREFEGLEVLIVTKRASLSVYGSAAVETGFAIGRDGFKVVGVISGGVQSGINAQYGYSFTVYPTMKSVYEAAGSGLQAGCGWGTINQQSAGLSYSFSGYLGGYYFIGKGLKLDKPVTGEAYYTYTIMRDKKVELSEFREQLNMAKDVITELIEKQKVSLAKLVDKKNRSDDNDERKEIQEKIDNKISNIAKLDKTLSIINNALNQINSDENSNKENKENNQNQL